MTRRQWLDRFVKAAVGIVTLVFSVPIAAMVGLSALRREASPWLQVGPIDGFRPGSPQPVTLSRQERDGWIFRDVRTTVYIVMQENGLKVLSNICPHANCAVRWEEGKEAFFCPCHDGYFDIEGRVVQGPPPAPLPEFPHKIEHGLLWVQLRPA